MNKTKIKMQESDRFIELYKRVKGRNRQVIILLWLPGKRNLLTDVSQLTAILKILYLLISVCSCLFRRTGGRSGIYHIDFPARILRRLKCKCISLVC